MQISATRPEAAVVPVGAGDASAQKFAAMLGTQSADGNNAAHLPNDSALFGNLKYAQALVATERQREQTPFSDLRGDEQAKVDKNVGPQVDVLSSIPGPLHDLTHFISGHGLNRDYQPYHQGQYAAVAGEYNDRAEGSAMPERNAFA